MTPEADGLHTLFVPRLKPGARYGLRADGSFDPAYGDWFDPDKLLVDPYAVAIDRPYVYDPRLAARRGASGDTAALVPKAIVSELPPALAPKPPLFSAGGLIYEANVRALTIRHPDIPEKIRGTLAAVAHPAIIEHLRKLNVAAIELMPIVAWIDERHLAAARADQCLGLQSGHLQGARSAPGARRHRRTARHGGGTARGRHRRHSRPGLQPHRRERRVRPDAVAARPR